MREALWLFLDEWNDGEVEFIIIGVRRMLGLVEVVNVI
jgi:hypothetical protein